MSAEQVSGKTTKLLKKFALWYRSGALLLLNTLVLFVVANACFGIAIKIRHKYSAASKPSDVYSEKLLAAVYPGLNEQEWKTLMTENWSRPCVFGGYLVFKEAPFQGKYVNVSSAGFRNVKDQGPWPPDSANINVFVFGGSTTFGYGVADDQTVASYLQESLRRFSKKQICVYNFGAGYYYSTQERILFERLLTQGEKPDIAIFVDGLNDLWHIEDDPNFEDYLEAVFNVKPIQLLVNQLPMTRIVRKVTKETFSRPTVKAQEQVRPALLRYQRNIKLIESACREFGVVPVFAWQPVPSYKYDTKYHLFYYKHDTKYHLFYPSPKTYQAQADGYREMEQIYREGGLGTHFLWCADLQENEKECLYVDGHHYTAKFAKKLAEQVCYQCSERGLLKQAGLESMPIGNP